METLKVLVVDDEPGIRSGVSRILSQHTVSYPFMDEDYHFICLEAATGEEGIDIINSEHPDIVLLDNKLPGIKGMQVLEYIRKKNLDTIVAMITSYASLEIAVKATDDGAYDFIPKPFTPQELKASVDNLTKQLFLKRITKKMKNEGKKIRYQFVSILSHELKAPLNAIEGYLNIMKEKQAGENIGDYEQMIGRALERIGGMRSLIMDLLDFTKIRLEKKREKVTRINLKKLAKDAISTINPYAIQKNVIFSLDAQDDVFIEADPNDMEIIFNNLLSNAVKYNRTDGYAEVVIKKADGSIIIQVKDTGIGMQQEEAALLFKDFVRIKNEKTKNITGSGLGLSIVRKITELYHGTINVMSEPDNGSTFTVTLPV
ncbi:MAG TPA: ATP-binding protein [Bacteroidales bacterium]|nr:ATP-binding protein [Bacteroidales bacterium]